MSKDDVIRKQLQDKYFIKWEPSSNDLIDLYNEYIDKLNEFINEIEELSKNISKKSFKPNSRQMGGYERCIINYPDEGWSTKEEQFKQAYKELMVDYLYYEPLEYDDLSKKEISIMKEMANFLIKQAEINKSELK